MDDGTFAALFDAALAARENAYAPYSGYPVGAAALSGGGGVFAGCNVENAAYPVGTCAEAGALAAMVAAGERALVAMVVVAEGGALVAPCGACRQRIGEFAANADVPVAGADPAGGREIWTVGVLLPHAFGPAQLRRKRPA